MCVTALPAWRVRMGGVTSRRRRHEDLGPWGWHGSPGDHSGYPQDLVAYPGDELLYCYIDIITKYKIMRNTMNLGHSVVTTNIEEFLEDLQACYKEGFILNHFVRIPCVKTTIEVQDWGEPYPYQAIFSRPAYRHPRKNDWELVIEKRILSTKLLATAEFEEKSDLINTIHEKAEEGARLVCAQPVGYVRSGTTNIQYSVMGVDLFFNVPKHTDPVKHFYHTIKVPIRYSIVPDASQTVQQIECDADWMGQLKIFLDKGWKLVDICMDATALADAFGMKGASRTIDTLWIFEKPRHKLDNFEPAYEGVILEYFHKSKRFLRGERPRKDWRPVIAGMGLAGWELVTIIQTPYLAQSTFTTYTMKLLMIFQRPYIEEHQEETKKLREKLAQEELEREQGKYAILGLSLAKSKSTSVPGTTAHSLNKSPSPRQKQKQYSPNLNRFVYADNTVASNPHRNGAVKRSQSSDDVLDNRPSMGQSNQQGAKYLYPQKVKPVDTSPEHSPSLRPNPHSLQGQDSPLGNQGYSYNHPPSAQLNPQIQIPKSLHLNPHSLYQNPQQVVRPNVPPASFQSPPSPSVNPQFHQSTSPSVAPRQQHHLQEQPLPLYTRHNPQQYSPLFPVARSYSPTQEDYGIYEDLSQLFRGPQNPQRSPATQTPTIQPAQPSNISPPYSRFPTEEDFQVGKFPASSEDFT